MSRKTQKEREKERQEVQLQARLGEQVEKLGLAIDEMVDALKSGLPEIADTLSRIAAVKGEPPFFKNEAVSVALYRFAMSINGKDPETMLIYDGLGVLLGLKGSALDPPKEATVPESGGIH